MQNKGLWFSSNVISCLLIAVLLFLWVQMNQYRIEPTQLTNEIEVENYLAQNWENNPEVASQPPLKIKTGIFIQSMQFNNASEVYLTGYIWQKYENGVHDQIKPAPGEVGFILPEQNGSSVPQEAYRMAYENEEVIGWYFDVALKQPFEYKDYPFDHKTVWVRMWSKEFSENIILVPDFDSYESTGLDNIFGIEPTIVLGTWDRENTYFDYKLSRYDTNFGIEDYIGQRGFPELHYNFVIKRQFANAFIVYLLPLFLVSSLLFAALMTVTKNSDLSGRHGFSTSGFIGASSALFFVVMIAHIQLREEVGGTDIVYIEYFYILMYAALVFATANTYVFTTEVAPRLKIIHYKDNIIPKVAYWPVLLTCLIFITLMVLY